jgi:hypothetical protein
MTVQPARVPVLVPVLARALAQVQALQPVQELVSVLAQVSELVQELVSVLAQVSELVQELVSVLAQVTALELASAQVQARVRVQPAPQQLPYRPKSCSEWDRPSPGCLDNRRHLRAGKAEPPWLKSRTPLVKKLKPMSGLRALN